MRDIRILFFLVALHASALTSCSGLDEDDGSDGPSGPESTAGAVEGSGSGGTVVVVDSGIETAQGGAIGNEQNGATNADASSGDSTIKDAGLRESGTAGTHPDSAVARADATIVVTEGGVQPPVDTRSCCEVHAEPGCDNAQTQACVCEKLPDCCSATWDVACTLIVTNKFCEPEVRECVCGPAAEGGWEQTQCCETEWTNFCDETAVIKCNAKAGC